MFIEYFLVIIVYIFFFLCLWIGKKIFIILIIFKIFDILGPPHFLRKAVQGKLKKYIKQNTKFNKIKTKKNAIYLLMPHGATFFPALRLPLLYDIEDEYPLFFINKWFLLIPGFVGMVKLFSGLIASERGNLKLAILQNARPLIIYPNGAKEVLHNSSKNSKRKILPIKKKILNYILESKKQLHIVVIKNESQCFYFNDFLIQFYKIINILLDIGVPFPLPFFTNKKLKLYMFKSINTKKIDDFRDLRRIIVKRVGDLK